MQMVGKLGRVMGVQGYGCSGCWEHESRYWYGYLGERLNIGYVDTLLTLS